jgi:hypothetical protein
MGKVYEANYHVKNHSVLFPILSSRITREFSTTGYLQLIICSSSAYRFLFTSCVSLLIHHKPRGLAVFPWQSIVSIVISRDHTTHPVHIVRD